MWTFARTSGPGPQFTVIGGYFVKRSGKAEESASIEPDESGAVVRLTDGHCDLIGAARDVFDYPPADMPAAKLKELANDAKDAAKTDPRPGDRPPRRIATATRSCHCRITRPTN